MAKRKKKKRIGLAKILVPVAAIITVLVLVLLLVIFMTRTEPAEVPKKLYLNPAYSDLITRYASENGCPAAYIAAIITAESSFDPEAVSDVGAMGLMQLMPDTANWIAEKFSETIESPDTMFDPETNLRYGTWYLSYLFRRYNGVLENSTAAYHQGQGTVDNWLENEEYAPDGIRLTNIPSAVTANYVEKVLTYYEAFKEMYP